MFLNSKFHHCHDLMLNIASADARGADGSLHFTVPSINRLNQTELETFSILPFWTFFRDSLFLNLNALF
jgi:hypothetical protein